MCSFLAKTVRFVCRASFLRCFWVIFEHFFNNYSYLDLRYVEQYFFEITLYLIQATTEL